MTITANSTGIFDFFHFSSDLPKRGFAIIKDKELTKEILWIAKKMVEVIIACSTIPKEYNRADVFEWAWKYDQIFR